MKKLIVVFMTLSALTGLAFADQDCISCHKKITPQIVTDWRLSEHSKNDVFCESCHGEDHNTMTDFAKVDIPTHNTCYDCHEKQVDQFLTGKHSKAWVALKAMPTTHWLPMELVDGQKGCGGCHKIGVKSEEEIAKLKADGHGFGTASCDACHTRHTFSKVEAQQPQACQTCHMGFDHPQWEMYSSSKHGVRYLLKQQGILNENTSAPTCQTCHMSEGNHAVRTAWGFLGVRTHGLAPHPDDDEEWWANRVTILQGLGVLDPSGNPTGRLDAVVAADVARLDADDFNQERAKMIKICSDCHSENYAKKELEKADGLIREGDKLMAQAIKTIAALYKDGILVKPESYSYDFPDLLTFHDAPRPIEQKLFIMFLKHRMRLFQGAFHANPDYSLWYGWSEMKMDLAEINEMAESLRTLSH